MGGWDFRASGDLVEGAVGAAAVAVWPGEVESSGEESVLVVEGGGVEDGEVVVVDEEGEGVDVAGGGVRRLAADGPEERDGGAAVADGAVEGDGVGVRRGVEEPLEESLGGR